MIAGSACEERMRVLGGEGRVKFLRWNVTDKAMNPDLKGILMQ
jgi:hypothetical protein